MHSYLSFGSLHLPWMGILVAAGLMASMGLSQRTARMAGVDPAGVWDLGLVTVFSAFFLSRALLVLENFGLFLHYPVLILELPALNLFGVAMAAVVAAAYLMRRKLPVLATLDALAPCMALTCAFISFGDFANGNRFGLPSNAPWAVESSFGRVHPVEIYYGIAWIVLCAALLAIPGLRPGSGDTFAWGLFLGGMIVIFGHFPQLPPTLYGTPLIERDEWEAVALMLAAIGIKALPLLLNVRPAKDTPHAV